MMRLLEGTATSIRFVAATRSGFKEDALREVSFSIESKNGQTKLLRRVRSRTGGASSADNRVDELLRDLISFKLAYRSGRESDHWTESWQNEADFPAAIRVQMADTKNGLIFSRTVSLAGGSR
jgi:hypothetical protein